MVTDILDWPLEYDGADDMGTRCGHFEETRITDRRCRKGYRSTFKVCWALIGSAETPRQLIALAEAHARADHGWLPS